VEAGGGAAAGVQAGGVPAGGGAVAGVEAGGGAAAGVPAGGGGGHAAAVLRAVRVDVGLGAAMGLLDSSRGAEGSSHLDDLEALEQVAELHPDAATFEAWLRELLAGPGRSDDGNRVTLSTVHRVKGMEWDRVILWGANAGILPHRLATDVEEERRVLHVAVTRGRHQVVVMADRTKPSPFLDELDRPSLLPPSGPTVAGGTVAGGTVAGGRVAGGTVAGGRVAGGRVAGGRVAGATGDRDAGGGAGRVGLGRVGVAAPAPSAGRAPADAALDSALRAWRLERCRRDRVPPYVVLSDRTLRAIVTARPGSLVTLRQVPGIGPAKLEMYGEEILALVGDPD
ncbi:MAG: HRDC domain-containing protein, partial [Acidimicrobiales bacterium]